jgi:hypothetical protein
MSKAAKPRSFEHVQAREPEGQRGLGAAFFAAKERREPAYMEALNLFFRFIQQTGSGRSAQPAIQLALFLQRIQLIATADMSITDENLGN